VICQQFGALKQNHGRRNGSPELFPGYEPIQRSGDGEEEVSDRVWDSGDELSSASQGPFHFPGLVDLEGILDYMSGSITSAGVVHMKVWIKAIIRPRMRTPTSDLTIEFHGIIC
jgi:hypothetical protein